MIIKELCALSAGSGDEKSVRAFLEEKLAGKCDKIYTDKLGNLIAVKRRGKESGPVYALDAHMDQIAMLVEKITDGGFLKISRISGIDKRVLPAARVKVHGKKEVLGVVSSTPPHASKPDERDNFTEISELFVDIGAADKAAAEAIVSVGDYITLCGEYTDFGNGAIASRSLDNRAGVSAILEIFLETENINLTAIFSSGEEAGLRGAKAAGFSEEIDTCIVVDTTFARTPELSEEEAGVFGGGAMIGIAPILDRALFSQLCEAAEGAYQIEVMNGGTGTNAFSYHAAANGIKTGLISIPIKNMHTGIEMMKLSDYESAKDILRNFFKEVAQNA